MKRAKLIDKLFRLLEKARLPDWLHHYGPKKYQLKDHALALFIKQDCKLSYRRSSNLLNGLGHIVPSYSALCKMSKRIPQWVWNRLLQATHGLRVLGIAALDGVFFSRRNPSYHYLKRIDSPMPIACPVQSNVLVDTKSRKVIALELHDGRFGEITDAVKLLSKAPPSKALVADKAYDAESLYEYCKKHRIRAHIPVKRNTHTGFYRHYFQKRFSEKTYHQRSIIESVFSSIKRCRGSHVSCKTTRGIKAEVYARFIAQNLKLVPLPEIFN